MDRRLRALNRFGLGARPGEAPRIDDEREWLLRQLRHPSVTAVDARTWAGAPTTMDEAGEVFSRLRVAQRARDQEKIAEARQGLRELQSAEVAWSIERRLTTETPFVERLVSFWSNHLCVSAAAKPQVAALAGHYERTAIRPFVMGRFEDMVLASARHPAMLFYLDNVQSVGPNSRAGRRTGQRGRPRGLNENYARELLELHTVGVGGGYDQTDVEQLARVLTGWGISGGRAGGPRSRGGAPGDGSRGGTGDSLGFMFREALHEPGDKTVMGVRYRESGVEEGEKAIRDLCRHPATARFIATKLVRHFAADEPPAAAVDSVATVFLESHGDLRAVSAAVVDLDGAWDREKLKFRTPQEWLIAVLRAFDVRVASPRMGPLLRQLRHSPWSPASPKGYGDMRVEWADPDALMNRAELARTLAQRVVRGAGGVDPAVLLSVVDVEAGDPLRVLLSDRSIATDERVALAIGGPAFQWR
jgi:uncharacterized protein (DUF1800 family)